MTKKHDPIHNLVDIVKIHSKEKPDDIAYTYLVDGEDQEVHITFGELDRQARNFAAALQKVSQSGDRALLLYPSGLEFIVAFLGCLYAGIIAAPTTVPHLKRSTPRLKLMMEDANAKIACTTRAVFEKIQSMLDEDYEFNKVNWIINEDIPENIFDTWKEPEVQPDDIAFLQYTSGSTSSPKGVMISNFNLIRTIEDLVIGSEFNDTSVMISWMPIFHDMGLIYGLLTPLYAGRPCYIMSPVTFMEKPFRWLKAISKYNGTHTGSPNFAFDVCAKKISEEEKLSLNLDKLKYVINAAEPVRLQTMKNFWAAFEKCGFNYDSFVPSYGLAEATVKVSTKKVGQAPSYCTLDVNEIEQNKLVFLAEGDPNGYTNVGCGWTSIGADIQIVNPKTGELAAADEIGEIWIKSDTVAKGYWHNPKATLETFNASIPNYDGGPFMRTGDMGFIYKDELYIAGRIKDMIIIQGRNYYPQDIELTVEKCDPAVRPSCGAAFAIDDSVYEHLIIVQEIKREYRKNDNLQDTANAIRMAVAKFHGLRASAVVLIKPSTIEKTTSGKIQRHATRESFLHGALEVLYEWRAPNLPAKTAEI
jgi:acyl-CoA synthetase (AMP-forming)/AMP-acid ligase II